MRGTILLPFFILVSSLLGQATLHVDISGGAPFTSIQAAINAAASGDTILVEPGVYDESLSLTKSVTVKSTQGPALTSLAPIGLGTGVVVTGAAVSATLEGLRITATADPSLLGPGGIQVTNSTVLVRNCAVTGCAGSSGSSGFGGGFFSAGYAGGIGINGGTVSLENCIIANNVGGDGAVDLSAGFPAPAPGGTGGVGVKSGSCTIRHCTIADNIGGNGAVASFLGLTFLGTGGTGGLSSQVSATVENSILWGNQGGMVGAISPTAPNEITGPVTVTHSDVAGSVVGVGNINSSPLFSAPASGDYSLQAGSPCIDAGVCSLVDVLGRDVGGHPRSRGFAPDMGAFEYQHDTTRAGTSEDILLTTVVNGNQADALLNTKSLAGGDTLDVHWESPCGSLDGALYFLVSQIYVPSLPPIPVAPHIFVDAMGGSLIQGPALMMPGGENLVVNVPMGSFSPAIVRVQLLVVTPLAQVLPFALATSDAQDIVLQ